MISIASQFPLAVTNDPWFALPLVIVISLVYAATRHETRGAILRHAMRFGLWITVFMVGIFVVLQFVSARL